MAKFEKGRALFNRQFGPDDNHHMMLLRGTAACTVTICAWRREGELHLVRGSGLGADTSIHVCTHTYLIVPQVDPEPATPDFYL